MVNVQKNFMSAERWVLFGIEKCPGQNYFLILLMGVYDSLNRFDVIGDIITRYLVTEPILYDFQNYFSLDRCQFPRFLLSIYISFSGLNFSLFLCYRK